MGVFELDTVALHWQLALDADERALNAAADVLTAPELAELRADLIDERRQTETGLAQLADATRVRPAPWLAPVAITPKMLGLPETVTACLFDLDGVLTDRGVVHSAELARNLHHRGVTALRGVRRYLEAAGHAGLKRAIVSASANAEPMLELAGLSTLVEDRVDATVIQAEQLRPRPAPDVLLAACGHLDVDPTSAVAFTQTPDGVAAGLSAGLLVVGVADDARAERLTGCGAEFVVPSLAILLDRRLRSA